MSVRDEIVDFLRRELVGPDPRPEHAAFHSDEILRPQDPPRLRYSAGVLFPQKTSMQYAEKVEGVRRGQIRKGQKNHVLYDEEILSRRRCFI